MELFVVKRHEEEEETVKENANEQDKLEKLYKKIEKNRLKRQKQKEKLPKPPAKEKSPSLSKNNENVAKPKDKNKSEKQKVTEQKPIEENNTTFQILGENFQKNKQSIKPVLANWLKNCSIIENDDVGEDCMKLLDEKLRKQLKQNNITEMFPVQNKLISYLLKSKFKTLRENDVCVCAPTGSGKTLTYVLPSLQLVKNAKLIKTKNIRVLVLVPTKDLALQVFKVYKTFAECLKIDVGLIVGDLDYEKEKEKIVENNEAFGFLPKPDILICTAGKLVRHLKETEGFDLSHLDLLIVDEADKILEQMQNDWFYHLDKNVPESNIMKKTLNLTEIERKNPPRKLLFSATLTFDPEKLEKLALFQPKLFTTSKRESGEAKTEQFVMPKELEEYFVTTRKTLKPLVLYKLIETENLTRTLIFTQSIRNSHRLAILLKCLFGDGKKIEEISSEIRNRNELIQRFSRGEVDLLICTDCLARGIDLPNVNCVISFEAPKHVKNYVHRAGRSARAGNKGKTITIFDETNKRFERKNIQEIVIKEEDLECLAEKYKDSLQQLKTIIESEERNDLNKTKSVKRKSLKRKRNE